MLVRLTGSVVNSLEPVSLLCFNAPFPLSNQIENVIPYEKFSPYP